MIDVVGGVYEEAVIDPAWSGTFGSGGRAAHAIGENLVALHTVTDRFCRRGLEALISPSRIAGTSRSSAIAFEYETAVSNAKLIGSAQVEMEPVEVENALIFGMVEATPRVTAEAAVVDPQHSLTAAEIIRGIHAGRIAVVANDRELHSLTGNVNPVDAARQLISDLGCDVVTAKCGALGVHIVDATSAQYLAPIPTESVFPIGSGDVFSATFADCWTSGNGAVESAREANRAVAAYVSTRVFNSTSPLMAEGLSLPASAPKSRPRIYVASSFATLAQRWQTRLVTIALEGLGGRAFSPLRDVGPLTEPDATAMADLEGLEQSDSILVLADDAGAGPHFEAGWAHRDQIPTVVYSTATMDDRYTMLRGTGATVVPDLPTAIYRSIWEAMANVDP